MTDSLCILIVDDNEDDRLIYRRFLTPDDAGCYLTQECEEADAALALLEKTAADCVVLDYSLPGRNGIDLLKIIRAKWPFLPVVMSTGQENIAVAVTAIREGAQNYLSKTGLSGSILKQTIRTAVRLCEMEKRLAEQRHSLELFTRALAHDLKEPVRTICSFLEILNRADLSAGKQKEYRDFVYQAAQRMGALIDSVYYILRPEGRSKSFAFCDAQQAFEAAVDNLSYAIQERKAEISSDPLPRVRGEAEQVSRVFQNLISNALQYGGAPPKVRVTVAQKDGFWLFRVSDNGPGIAPENLEKIFTPFKRLQGGDSGNLGLGLAICRKIVESYGGTISCQSLPGQGTSFSFSLLAAPAPVLEQLGLVPEATGVRGGGDMARLMIVDDSEADIALCRYALEEERLECEIQEMRSGQELLRFGETKAPADLVLLDINMPGLDGFEVLRALKASARTRAVPVIICSTSNHDNDKATAYRLGAAGYLLKPLSFSKFKEIVQAIPTLSLLPSETGLRLCRACP